MKARIGTFVVTVVLMAFFAAWSAAPAVAIQDGSIDTTGRYPNVLCVWAEWDVPGQGQCGTGQLIAPNVVLTAGHLTAHMEFGDLEIRVSTSAEVPVDADASRMIRVARAVTYPAFFTSGPNRWRNDIGVLILARPINGVPLVQLPTEGLLDDLRAEHGTLDNVSLTAVGYGLQFDDAGNLLFETMRRRYGPVYVNGLPDTWLNIDLPETRLTDGDSGSCVFVADTFTCVASIFTRIDTASARSFLGEFVTLP